MPDSFCPPAVPIVCVVRKLGRPGFYLSWFEPEFERWHLRPLLTEDRFAAQRAAVDLRTQLWRQRRRRQITRGLG